MGIHGERVERNTTVLQKKIASRLHRRRAITSVTEPAHVKGPPFSRSWIDMRIIIEKEILKKKKKMISILHTSRRLEDVNVLLLIFQERPDVAW